MMMQRSKPVFRPQCQEKRKVCKQPPKKKTKTCHVREMSRLKCLTRKVRFSYTPNCPSCQSPLKRSEISKGFVPSASKYISLCPHCHNAFTPRLWISYEGHTGFVGIWYCQDQLKKAVTDYVTGIEWRLDHDESSDSLPIVTLDLEGFCNDRPDLYYNILEGTRRYSYKTIQDYFDKRIDDIRVICTDMSDETDTEIEDI